MLVTRYFKCSCLSRFECATWETERILQEEARRDVDFWIMAYWIEINFTVISLMHIYIFLAAAPCKYVPWGVSCHCWWQEEQLILWSQRKTYFATFTDPAWGKASKSFCKRQRLYNLDIKEVVPSTCWYSTRAAANVLRKICISERSTLTDLKI